MITKEIQSESYRTWNIEEPGYHGASILEKPALFIIRSKDFPESELQRFGSLLNPWEWAKSRQFNRKADRESYILLHGLLRSMLANSLGMPPECIKFHYNQNGKPYVSGAGPTIFFNMSHSSDISLLGFDPVSEVGVDVEKINLNVDYEAIIRHFFTPGEISYIHERNEKPIRRFFEIWTRKEALLKAIGTGITENLDVDMSGVTPPRLKHVSNGVKNIGMLHLKTLAFGDDYILSTASANGFGKVFTYNTQNK